MKKIYGGSSLGVGDPMRWNGVMDLVSRGVACLGKIEMGLRVE